MPHSMRSLSVSILSLLLATCIFHSPALAMRPLVGEEHLHQISAVDEDLEGKSKCSSFKAASPCDSEDV